MFASCFIGAGEMDALALVYFAKIVGLHVRTIGVCGYRYICGCPRKICLCGYQYEYGWEISYARQAWVFFLRSTLGALEEGFVGYL